MPLAGVIIHHEDYGPETLVTPMILSVASIGSVSPGAATDGVTPIFSSEKKTGDPF